MSKTVQIDALTGARGLAAWYVVLFHIHRPFADSLPTSVDNVLAKGYLAVDFFFVLLGFVLWLAWGPRLQLEGWRAVPGFLVNRFARIWPLHAVMLGATVLFSFVAVRQDLPIATLYRWHELPLHVLLVQNWMFTDALGWNVPSWSISTELAAYGAMALAVPMLFRASGNALSPRKTILYAGLAIVALIALLGRIYANAGARLLEDFTPQLGLLRCFVGFGCGVCACIIWKALSPAVLRTGCLAVAIAVSAAWHAAWIGEVVAIPALLVAVVPWIASTSARHRNPLSSRIAVFLGTISYSTYLCHFLLWAVFKMAFIADPGSAPLALGALFVALTLAVSFGLYHLIEVPSRRWLGTSRRRVAQLA